MIRFECLHCGHPLKAHDGAADKLGECPRCRKPVPIPKRSTVAVASRVAGDDSEDVRLVAGARLGNVFAPDAAPFETVTTRSTWSEPPPRPAEPIVFEEVPPPPPPTKAAKKARRKRPNPIPMISGLAVIVAGLGALILFVGGGSDSAIMAAAGTLIVFAAILYAGIHALARAVVEELRAEGRAIRRAVRGRRRRSPGGDNGSAGSS